MKFNGRLLGLIPLFLHLITFEAHSNTLSQESIYYRCHAQFTRFRPLENDPLLDQIRSKKMTAVDACMKILQESELTHLGKMRIENKRTLNILKIFQSFHMSWFPSKDFLRQETENPTTNLFDSNEMGYHLTYNLLAKDTKYSEVLTRKNSFRGVRQYSEKATYLLDPNSHGRYEKMSLREWTLNNSKNQQSPWKPTLVQFGILHGLELMKLDENRVSLYYGAENKSLSFSLTSSQGGGILGTVPYIMLNSNQYMNLPNDDELNVHRSWSKAIFSDLLCRTLPVLRKNDVEFLIEKNSSISFRNSASCMQCHSTIDPMASVIRNSMNVRLDPLDLKNDLHFSPRAIAFFEQTMPKKSILGQKDPFFHLRPKEGRVFFRSYNGELIDKKVEGVSQLGEVLARTDDFYICAAKRYFEFMTGINVKIDDFSISKNKTFNNSSMKYRKFVIDLGLELKSDQSLKNLVKKIISSSFYSKNDYGVSDAQ